MDLSGNKQIDFLYLTNPALLDKYKTQQPKEALTTKEDIKFYRRRILLATKDYLREKTITNEVTGAFENYASELIKHFKFIDKKDMIQSNYSELSKTKSKPDINFKLEKENKLMLKKKLSTNRTIQDCIPLIIKKSKSKKKIIIPKQRTYNIKDPNLREKGIK